MADNEKVKFNPLSEPQLRINEDGTAEISGKVRLDMLEEGAEAFNAPSNIADGAIPYVEKFKFANPNPAFYAKGKLVIENKQVQLDIQKAEVGRASKPLDKLPISQDEIEGYAEQILDVVPGMDIKSLSFEDGKMSFDGTLPEKVSTVRKAVEG